MQPVVLAPPSGPIEETEQQTAITTSEAPVDIAALLTDCIAPEAAGCSSSAEPSDAKTTVVRASTFYGRAVRRVSKPFKFR